MNIVESTLILNSLTVFQNDVFLIVYIKGNLVKFVMLCAQLFSALLGFI